MVCFLIEDGVIHCQWSTGKEHQMSHKRFWELIGEVERGSLSPAHLKHQIDCKHWEAYFAFRWLVSCGALIKVSKQLYQRRPNFRRITALAWYGVEDEDLAVGAEVLSPA